MSITVILAPTLDIAEIFIKTNPPEYTVEAEYGSSVVRGTVYTAAHHGAPGTPFVGRHLDPEGRPAPCNDLALKPVFQFPATVLVSHLDLDTFGGCLRLMPEFQDLFTEAQAEFWSLAEFVDVRGAHRRLEWKGGVEHLERLDAFWAWSKTHSPRVDPKVTADMTAAVIAAGEALRAIFAEDPVLMAAGRAFRAGEASLNRATFRGVWTEPVIPGGELFHVIWRQAEGPRDFCNHLYTTPQGTAGHAVLSHNTATGAITLSFAMPVEGVSCAKVMQSVFGPDAGGHAGIAGTPRGVRFDAQKDLDRTQAALVAAIRAAVVD